MKKGELNRQEDAKAGKEIDLFHCGRCKCEITDAWQPFMMLGLLPICFKCTIFSAFGSKN